MDKLAIKKYAVWARRELISRVSTKALQYGISEEDCGDSEAESVNGHLLTAVERKQRRALIAQIKEKGYTEVMEEVAYTWFNRFSALRFMEVNGYLPSHVRVFTDEENNFKPQIITEAIHLELDGLDMEKVYAFKEANQTDELYKYLLIVQCNALNAILPGMFQKIDDYTELLFPDNLLREGSVIEQVITMIPEEDWQDAVQIIGWLYQYYNAEKKDDVSAALKKNVKISKENIPAATQLFTPDWIVRYMVENSLGRLWLEGHPTNKDTLLPTAEEQSAYCAGNRESEDRKWHYYLEEAEQEPDVQAKLAEIRKEYATMKPEDIRCIDPCCGSGHILAYLFDVLVQIYEDYGYTTREAVSSIVENNIYGLDIDDRAAQLANFAVMMKARQYDRRFFSRGIQPHVYAIVESNSIKFSGREWFGDEWEIAQKVIDGLHDAKEYGSILNFNVTMDELVQLRKRLKDIEAISNDGNLFEMMNGREIFKRITPIINIVETMVQKYEIVVTNPPYMSSNGMDLNLNTYVKKAYPNSWADMSTVCMERSFQMCKNCGYVSMINIPVWMFLSTFIEFRKHLLKSNTIINMIHPGRGIFGSDFGTTTFVFCKNKIGCYRASYRRLFSRQGEVESAGTRKKQLLDGKGKYYAVQKDFGKIPGTPIVYWGDKVIYNTFLQNHNLAYYLDARSGISTGDNDLFYRFWYECSFEKINFDPKNTPLNSRFKWFPTIRGGDYRKWYGNMDNVLNLENGAYQIKNSGKNYRLRTPEYYNRFGITWNRISASVVGFRIKKEQVNFGENSPCMFSEKVSLYNALGFLNSKIALNFLLMLNPTLTYQVIDLQNLPYKKEEKNTITEIVKKNINMSKNEWDSFETSWDFEWHPLLHSKNSMGHTDIPVESFSGILEENYDLWRIQCNNRFNQLKSNEEELNRIFIDIYGLQKELTPEVEDKDITVRKADLQRDIKSLLSYAVGCMFGRYSLDTEGLVYAGGEWDASKYQKFPADEDNIIPICDDEYFEDDIVGRLIEFVKVVYGEESLEANLQFIADALGGKGSSREVIRNYFRNDFFKDHCKIYQKRPIYWLFDSGKKGGFKALIYMHRYQPDTIARMRTDYVHEQQARYRTAIEGYEQRAAAASGAERVTLNKKLKTLREQSEELHGYEEKIHHLADQMISIDLDDGVKHNYAIFQDVLAKIK